MSLVRYENHLPDIFDRFFRDDFFQWSKQLFGNLVNTYPSVNISETSKGYEMELAVPGLSKKEISVKIEDGILVVKGETKENVGRKLLKKLVRKEFNYKYFKRSFRLPTNIDSNMISAEYKDGILRLELPFKGAKSSKSKQILIK